MFRGKLISFIIRSCTCSIINASLPGVQVVMLIAGPLIRVLGDRYGWHVKVATLEALVQLVRKVRIMVTIMSTVCVMRATS